MRPVAATPGSSLMISWLDWSHRMWPVQGVENFWGYKVDFGDTWSFYWLGACNQNENSEKFETHNMKAIA